MNPARTAALEARLFDARLAEGELRAVREGHRKGLYRLLADSGPISARDFAPLAGLAPDRASDWLEQQAAAGLLDVIRPGDETTREYLLPGEHIPVLLAGESPFSRAGIAGRLREWVSAVPFASEALAAGGTILDVGPGEGWSTLALAQAFPDAAVVGAEPDDRAVLIARAAAAAAGFGDRVTFLEVQLDDARTLAARLPDAVTLVTAFESLSRVRNPIGALVAFRALLGPHGAVLVALPRLPDTFTAPADAVGRRAHAEGRVLRTPRLREWATATGFVAVELPIDHDQWRWFRLDPAG